jgi:hypothetical protein
MNQPNIETVVDYAYPCMIAEKNLRDLHNAAIEGRLADAKEFALEAITQARLTYQALVAMSERQARG